MALIGAFDRHENRNAQPDLVLIDQRDAAQDHAVGLQPLDTFPARGGGQPHPIADLGDGQRSVLLQHGENLAVDGVEPATLLNGVNGKFGHKKNFLPRMRFVNLI
jgi:hypothetical protein